MSPEDRGSSDCGGASPHAAERRSCGDPSGGADSIEAWWPTSLDRLAWIALLVQATLMIAFSTVQYNRYGLGNDFAGYAQAWHLIGHGHLNPYVTIFQIDFLHNNLDLVMYPLALVGRLVPSPVILSWAQDLAVVGTEAVALLWIRDVLRSRPLGHQRAAGFIFSGAVGLVFIDPWSWETAAFSLHFEAVATLFAVLVGRDLWRGRYTRLLLWIPLAIGSEALGSLYVLVAGLGFLLSRRALRRARWAALGVTVAGAAGLELTSRLGLIGRSGATLSTTYAYLLPHHNGQPSALQLIIGAASHPAPALGTLDSHLFYVLGYVLAAGSLGLASSWGLTATVLIILPNALGSGRSFIDFRAAFQSWAAQPFLLLGTVLVLTSLIERSARHQERPWSLPRGLGLTVATLSAVLAWTDLSSLTTRWISNSTSAQELKLIASALPPGAEVVADQDIDGRMAIGRTSFALVTWNQRFPVLDRPIVIVRSAPRSRTDAARQRDLVQALAGSRLVLAGHYWTEMVWVPPAGIKYLTVGNGRSF